MVETALRDLDARAFADVETLRKASDYVCQLQSKIENFDQVDAILAALPESDSKHSTIVCLVSLLILHEMQSVTKQAEENLALGALLHDVGLRFLPQELLAKEPHLRTREETELFESHPLKGVESLRSVKNLSQDVLLIVAEHHELANGTGFPKRIRDVKISPLARIVSLADAFAELIHNPGGREYKPDEALTYLHDVLGAPFNRAAFSALKNIINRRYIQDRRKAAG
jgi:HD-GYP domain-containing protein (c-di-GMP phosphodiesterase class II)